MTKKRNPNTLEEKVPVFLPRADEGEDFVTVTVNGINYQIACGTEVFVPRKVALILAASARQEEAAYRFIHGLESR